jgi:D-sedoheptulose 7-phosphate isomerase
MKSRFVELVDASADAIRSTRAFESQIERGAGLLLETLQSGHKLLCCGNGGSAADASHMAAEFVIRFQRERGSWPAISLNADGAVLTAGGNDYGFDEVFSKQIDAFAQPGDLLAVFSTSGNSPNIVKALRNASTRGIPSISFLGKGGGASLGLATIEMIVDSHNTANIQEAHHFLMHALCELVDAALARVNDPAST